MSKNKKVLIVEDESAMLQALKYKFESENFIVFTAKNGLEGLKEAEKNNPDIILLDIIMPKMDGVTMLDKLRHEKWGKKIPVIVLTNLSEAEKIGEVAKSGSYDYLVKTDWQIDEVVKKARERMKK
jgi:two-component system alkaline phosphatase synthesis response regulator PhoP